LPPLAVSRLLVNKALTITLDIEQDDAFEPDCYDNPVSKFASTSRWSALSKAMSFALHSFRIGEPHRIGATRYCLHPH
jgi:hypothetical protein